MIGGEYSKSEVKGALLFYFLSSVVAVISSTSWFYFFAVTDSTGWMKALSPSTSTPQLELSTGWV